MRLDVGGMVDQAVVVITCTLLGFYALRLLCCLLFRRTREGAWRLCASLLAWVRSLAHPCGSKSVESDLDLKARAHVAGVRVRLVLSFSEVAVHFLALVLAWTLASFLANTPNGLSESCDMFGFTAEFRRRNLLVDQLIWFNFCLVFASIPRLRTHHSMTFQYVLCSVWWAAYGVMSASNPMGTLPTRIHSYLPRIVAGFVVGNSRACGFCNFLICAGVCVAHVLHYAGAEAMTRAELGLVEPVVTEVVGTTIIVASIVSFDRWACGMALSALDIKSLAQSEATVLRLLSALCDAVVTLGPELRISHPAPKLANLLIQNRRDPKDGSRSALVGTNFLDFMVETDRERFRDFMARAPELESSADPEPAQALNVHLRDSSGLGVQVQLFHSRFRDRDDQVGHLIGICEVGDTVVAETPRPLVAISERPNFALSPQGVSSRSNDAGGRGTRGGSSMLSGGRTPRNSGAASHCHGHARGGLESSGAAVSAETASGQSISYEGSQSHDASREGRLAAAVASTRGSVGDGLSSADGMEDESTSSWFGDSVSVDAPGRMNTLAPHRSPSEDRIRRGAQPRAGEVDLCFDTLRFTVKHRRSSVPALDVSLLDRESLLQWISQWGSCRAWMQDFVNAILRPVVPASWPPAAGAPCSASFQVSFRASCALPHDFLTRPAVAPIGEAQAALPIRLPVTKVRMLQKRPGLRRGDSSQNQSSPRNLEQFSQVAPALVGVASGSVSSRTVRTVSPPTLPEGEDQEDDDDESVESARKAFVHMNKVLNNAKAKAGDHEQMLRL